MKKIEKKEDSSEVVFTHSTIGVIRKGNKFELHKIEFNANGDAKATLHKVYDDKFDAVDGFKIHAAELVFDEMDKD